MCKTRRYEASHLLPSTCFTLTTVLAALRTCPCFAAMPTTCGAAEIKSEADWYRNSGAFDCGALCLRLIIYTLSYSFNVFMQLCNAVHLVTWHLLLLSILCCSPEGLFTCFYFLGGAFPDPMQGQRSGMSYVNRLWSPMRGVWNVWYWAI